MIERTLVQDLSKHADADVIVCGFVERVRDQKSIQFIVIGDETGSVQVVNPLASERDDLRTLVSSLTPGSAVEVRGRVVINERVKLGGLEVSLDELIVHSPGKGGLPIDDKSTLDRRLDWRYVDLRRPANRLIFRVQTTLERALRDFWSSRDFVEIHTPKFMGSPSESGAELFSVPYFDRTAYLAQSPQFYKQMAIAAGFGSVFEIGPVFRANPSFTSRHDTEFTSIDVETSWIESHEDVMALEEAMLRHMLSVIRAEHGDAIRDMFGVEVIVPSAAFPRVTLSDALRIVKESGHTIERETGDLDPEGERRVAAWAAKEHGSEFVFVTDYPTAVRPFYHMRYPSKPGVTKSFDLLWRGLEITTGAQREHRMDILTSQALEKGLTSDGIGYYLDFFRHGCPPHGGFGVGLTRLLMILLDVSNVREVTFLYRGPNRLSP